MIEPLEAGNKTSKKPIKKLTYYGSSIAFIALYSRLLRIDKGDRMDYYFRAEIYYV